MNRRTPKQWMTLLPRLRPAGVVLSLALCLLARGAFGFGVEVAFDAANKLFEEGKYADAAAAYEKMLADGQRSASVYYNLGTAYYRAGQMGRCTAAFRKAEQLTPRDASLRANLQFVRKRVNGEEKTVVPAWRAWLTLLTLNEGTLLTSTILWAWFLLLAAGEWKPSLKPTLRTYTRTAGILLLLTGGCLAVSAYVRLADTSAVIVVKEAVVRFGPLSESQTAYQLPDGAEATVLDTKEDWLQIRDLARRVGWVKRDQVIVLGSIKPAKGQGKP
jgi:tetratricopeptide (TPR) repeat protein